MTVYLAPTGDDFSDEWNPTPAGTSFTTVDDDRRFPANDADYVQGDLGPTGRITFDFTYPAAYTATDYGDGTAFRTIQIPSVTLFARLGRTAGGTSAFTWIARRGGVEIDLGTGSFTAVVPNFEEESFISTIDPYTSSPWTPALLATTPFGIRMQGAALPQSRLSRFYIGIEEADWPGEQRARIGPTRGEPSYYCYICSVPMHLSQLVRPQDPLHPHFGKLICPDDLDEATEIEDDIFRARAPQEGDIEFDIE